MAEPETTSEAGFDLAFDCDCGECSLECEVCPDCESVVCPECADDHPCEPLDEPRLDLLAMAADALRGGRGMAVQGGPKERE